MNTTIICFDGGGDLDGRHDLNRSDVPPAVLHFHKSTDGQRGARAQGYEVVSAGRFGSRLVVHARSVELIQRVEAAEMRDRAEERSGWL